ncbi:MAG: hypothetical protein KF763_11930 [Cyclobacteriaceae bacterium]|nr:hypothetical protein [Cyclobacteriaceae bacterium]
MKAVRVVLVLVMLASVQINTQAQCAMCRTTLENNVSNGDIGIAAGINFGILYLFAAPYLIIGIIAFFWYRTSKNAGRKQYI